jgi:SAM-dependent methyltransferase
MPPPVVFVRSERTRGSLAASVVRIADVSSDFAGRTAVYYRRYRRDVPEAVVQAVVERAGAGPGDLGVDVGSGTGQLAVPLARRIGTVLAVETEPAMLALLRARSQDDGLGNLLCLLAADTDLSAVAAAVGESRCSVVTVANALHWMDGAVFFDAAHRLLRPGGVLAVVTHGVPLWLGDTPWARALRRFLGTWLGSDVGSSCSTDVATLRERRAGLVRAGFSEVELIEQDGDAPVDVDYVLGHFYSAMSEEHVPARRRDEFEDGIRSVLEPFAGSALVEQVPVTVLLGRR